MRPGIVLLFVVILIHGRSATPVPETPPTPGPETPPTHVPESPKPVPETTAPGPETPTTDSLTDPIHIWRKPVFVIEPQPDKSTIQPQETPNTPVPETQFTPVTETLWPVPETPIIKEYFLYKTFAEAGTDSTMKPQETPTPVPETQFTPVTETLWPVPDTFTPVTETLWPVPDTFTPVTETLWPVPDTPITDKYFLHETFLFDESGTGTDSTMQPQETPAPFSCNIIPTVPKKKKKHHKGCCKRH